MGASRILATNAWLAISLALAAAGCGGNQPRVTPESHLSETVFEKEQAIAGLRESLAQQREAIAVLKTQAAEKESFAGDLARTETSLQLATESVEKLTAEKADLEKSLAEVRESEKKIRETHEKLKEMASTSTEELADIKARAESAIQEKTKLGTENKAIARQLDVALKELDDVKSELTRTRAVVRSLQDNAPIRGASPVEAALQLRVGELEKALADASAGREAAPATEPAAPAHSTPEVVASAHGKHVTWTELVGTLKDRYDAALQGQFRGDEIDWAVAGVAGGLLLLVLVVLGLLLRGRKLRRQLREIRACSVDQADDLERAVDVAAGLAEESPAAPPAGKAAPKTADAPPRAPSRRSTYLPREDRAFSAVIASTRVKKERKPEPETGEDRDAERPEPERVSPEKPAVEKPVLEKPKHAPARTPEPKSDARAQRKVIGLFSGDAETPRPSPVTAKTPAKPIPERKAKESRAPVYEEPPAEDEMASTQIISPLEDISDVEPPAKKRADEEGGDKEILDELQSIINKKFDELMNK